MKILIVGLGLIGVLTAKQLPLATNHEVYGLNRNLKVIEDGKMRLYYKRVRIHLSLIYSI